jgi:hypothetical protein
MISDFSNPTIENAKRTVKVLILFIQGRKITSFKTKN